MSRTLKLVAFALLGLLSALVAQRNQSCRVPAALLSQDLSGKTFVVTGGNAGLGFEVARQLARQNASVIIGCRSASRAEAALQALKQEVPHARVKALSLDLNDLATVAPFAAAVSALFPRIDGLVLNAGIMVPPLSLTAQGYESQWGTNHLGHFAVAEALRPAMEAAAGEEDEASSLPRVVIVSSLAHTAAGALDLSDLSYTTRPYSRFGAYAQSKLANVLHARELARRTQGKLTVASLHPGTVLTDIVRHYPAPLNALVTAAAPLLTPFLKDPWLGAQTTLYTLLSPQDVPAHNGGYWEECAPSSPAPAGADDAAAAALWEASAAAVAPFLPAAAAAGSA